MAGASIDIPATDLEADDLCLGDFERWLRPDRMQCVRRLHPEAGRRDECIVPQQAREIVERVAPLGERDFVSEVAAA